MNTYKNHINQNKQNLMIRNTRPSSSPPDWTSDENDWNKQLRAHAIKLSSENNAEDLRNTESSSYHSDRIRITCK
jgi:hypothetical protein